jgi:hypothetical protein
LDLFRVGINFISLKLIAELTSAVCCASKRSLVVQCAVSGQAPCSGAKLRGKGLDEVSSAILGDAVAENGGDKRPKPRRQRTCGNVTKCARRGLGPS